MATECFIVSFLRVRVDLGNTGLPVFHKNILSCSELIVIPRRCPGNGNRHYINYLLN